MTDEASERARQADLKARQAKETQVGWKMAGIGFTAATEVIAGAALGFLVDWLAGTGRTWTIVGALLGIAVSMWTLLRGTLKLNKELDTDQRNARKKQG